MGCTSLLNILPLDYNKSGVLTSDGCHRAGTLFTSHVNAVKDRDHFLFRLFMPGTDVFKSVEFHMKIWTELCTDLGELSGINSIIPVLKVSRAHINPSLEKT